MVTARIEERMVDAWKVFEKRPRCFDSGVICVVRVSLLVVPIYSSGLPRFGITVSQRGGSRYTMSLDVRGTSALA